MRRLAGARRVCLRALAAAACAVAFAAQAREITLSIGDLTGPGFAAQSVRATLSGAKLEALAVEMDRLTVADRHVRKPKFSCADTEVTGERLACSRGVLDLVEKIPVSFAYLTRRRELSAEAKPAADEVWRLAGRFEPKRIALELKIDKARLERLAPLLPPGLPRVTGGRATGTISMLDNVVKARVEVEGAAFADASGLHAGEKITAAIEADAAGKDAAWRWSARLAWKSGEVFWQPVFMAGKGQRVELEGVTAGGTTHVRNGRIDLPGIASMRLSAEWNHAKGVLTALEAGAQRVRAAALYEELLKPLVQGTALADLRADGELTFTVKAAGDDLIALDLDLYGVSFEDRQRRFAVFGLNGRVPWRRDAATAGEVALKGAEFLKIPVGAVRVPLRLRNTRVDVDKMRVPLLDGAVVLRDFRAGMASDGWRWRFAGEVEPISMVQLSQALGLPVMHGSLAGAIPELRYRRGTLAMDGALLLRLFDGTITASGVELIEPFGRAPRLHANLDLKNLDLELLTRTYDFGTITGRIDARVRGLELVNWEPVKFDAALESSAGTYPRKISQRAVQNISALGGAGAAAAIQRSLLRFFDQFGYERLGVSCRLENGVCAMDGIERAPQGYVIVKGGGIPAISVIGYNRSVHWGELVDRLKRITHENVKPIVK